MSLLFESGVGDIVVDLRIDEDELMSRQLIQLARIKGLNDFRLTYCSKEFLLFEQTHKTPKPQNPKTPKPLTIKNDESWNSSIKILKSD